MEFSLKPVSFFGRQCVIVCQNENGPCPLIAIANVLLLQSKISICPDLGIISLAELTQIIANAILEKIGASSLPEHVKLLESVLNILPKLAQGLDLNVRFAGVDQFEFTEEISVFDSLGIRLLHGWVYDHGNAEVAGIVSNMSYNHVLFRLVEYKSSLSPPKPAEAEANNATKSEEEQKLLRYEGEVLEKFLNDTASQFTYHGMLALYNAMHDREFAVFFRNNHFSTLYFYNGQLFTLVTDLGYRHESRVVWEVLNSIDGDCEFYNEEFVPLSSLPQPASMLDVAAAMLMPSTDVPSSPSSRGGTSAQVGTIAAPPVGYKYGTVASPRSSSTASGAGVDVGAGVNSGIVEATAPPASATEQQLLLDTPPPNSSPERVEVAPASIVYSPLICGDEQTSTEVIPATVSEALETPPTEGVLRPQCAPDTVVSSPTEPVSTVGPESQLSPAAANVTAQQPPATASATAQSAFTPTTSTAAAAPPKAYDADLLLAIQLQEQEDALARISAAQQQLHQTQEHVREFEQQFNHFAAHVNLDAVEQEERDRLHALRLHHEELEAQRLEQERRRAASGQSGGQQQYTTYARSQSGGFPYNQSRSEATGRSSGKKDSNCSIS